MPPLLARYRQSYQGLSGKHALPAGQQWRACSSALQESFGRSAWSGAPLDPSVGHQRVAREWDGATPTPTPPYRLRNSESDMSIEADLRNVKSSLKRQSTIVWPRRVETRQLGILGEFDPFFAFRSTFPIRRLSVLGLFGSFHSTPPSPLTHLACIRPQPNSKVAASMSIEVAPFMAGMPHARRCRRETLLSVRPP